jgi:acyl-CoA dehydrogenase
LVEAITYGDGWAYPLMPDGGIAEILLLKLGTEQQKQRYIEGGRRGEFTLSGWAMTEETGGNDVASIKTTITRDGNQYVINGTKRFLSNGADADWAVVFGTIDPTRGMAGIRAVIVERGTPGFVITREAENKMGMRFNRQGAYRFDDARVPATNFLGDYESSADLISALATFNRTRPYCGSASVAVGQASLDLTGELLTGRRREISQHRWDRMMEEFAHMNHLLNEQRQLIYRSAWLNDRGLADVKESAAAKVHAPRLAEAIILRCMQLLGPEAISEEHLLEKWYRDTRLLDIVEGTAHIQKMVISRQLLGHSAARA